MYGSSLESLDNDVDQESDKIAVIPIDKIKRTPDQVRRYFDPMKMNQLVSSVRIDGILENLIVSSLNDGKFQLISGERRLRAAKEVGLTEVPVKILNLDEFDAFRISLIENLQREDLNPVEETDGIIKLLAGELHLREDEVVSLLYQMQNSLTRQVVNHNVVVQENQETVEKIFNYLGRLSWQSFVKHRLPLRKLPVDILEFLRQGKLAYTKAQLIARIKDQEFRKEMLNVAVTEELSLSEIRTRISEFAQKEISNNPDIDTELRKKTAGCLKALKKSKAINSPTKQKKLRKILEQLEKLLES
ncbi:chromosome partitioning protein, ParB family, putative (plasmid) [Acaryochloris marina MBIC11017]|uniref:Chromosome partitioning protein, ParB family, putative n=1 Tax=Acaryochloris marina (strain MBIC 11017) TaxID=329726 RepID=A8ZKQ4_ACAM1|nr:chromosome partitioning protein, ParB family, putative [Acaryochloris marina MBIC11017]